MAIAQDNIKQAQPYIANRITINKVKNGAHWSWLHDGWKALLKSKRPSLIIGGLVVFVSWALVIALYATGWGTLIPAVIGGFILIAPLISTAVFGVSRQVDMDGEAKRFRKINMQPNSKSQLGFIGFSIFFIVISWAIFAHLIWSIAVGINTKMDEAEFLAFILSTPQGLWLLGFGTLTGGALAAACFMVCAISLPLVYDQDIDALSAMFISVKSVFKNPIPMISWAFVIAILMVMAAPVGFIPLLIFFPWLGHTAWKAYKEIITVN